MKSYVVEKELVLHNLALLQKKAGDTPIWAVLKGDGYGLGIRPMAQLCREGSIDRFAVTEPGEAQTLRELFPKCQILMLRPTADPAELEQLLTFGNAVGALSVQRYGAIPAIPTLAETESFLHAQGLLGA